MANSFMTPVSKRKLSKELEERIKRVFLDQLAEITDKEKMASFMGRILTESEKVMLAKRLVAFVMIDWGVDDLHISQSLYLTRETVARFRLIFTAAKEKKELVVNMVQRLQFKTELKKLLKQLLIGYVLPATLGRIPRKGIF